MRNLYIVWFITFSSEPANRKLTKELCDVIDDFGFVNFSTLDIQVCIWKTIKIKSHCFSSYKLLWPLGQGKCWQSCEADWQEQRIYIFFYWQ
jgi:hypothetical protein